MKNERFKLLQFKVGDKLLQYILNYDLPLSRESITDYNFGKHHLETLATLEQIIHGCEILNNQRQYGSIKEHLFQISNVFNQFRKNCGGTIHHPSSTDELLNYLLSKTIEFYPCLLIVTNPLSFKFKSFESFFPHSEREEDYISGLITKHPHLHKLLRKSNMPFFSTFSFKLSNNNIGTTFLHHFVEQFIVRSFLNCCYRTNYSIENVLSEVESQYKDLIKIAEGKSINVSFFCGISGLRLNGIVEYKLTNNLILRNINEVNNPGISDTISTSTNNNENLVIGCILEYQIVLESFSEKIEENKLYEATNHFVDLFIETFTHAIILSQNSIYPPINFTFIDRSFPLNQKFPHFDRKAVGCTILGKEQLDEVAEWFQLLNETNLIYVNLTMKRIKSAIYNSDNPLASILDAFISWESMFSSKISTTNSVVKSIAKMLKRCGYEISNNKLQALYALRSDIVHGNPAQNKIVVGDETNNNLGILKKETIEIALRVFKGLLNDPILLPLTPNDRVLNLLSPEIVECEKCGNIKYKFN